MFEYELFPELLSLAVALLGSLLDAIGLLQGVRSLQSPGVKSRLQGGVVENAAGQQDGRTPLWRILQRERQNRWMTALTMMLVCVVFS